MGPSGWCPCSIAPVVGLPRLARWQGRVPQCPSCRCARSTGVGGVRCAVVRRRVSRGVLPGKAGLPGVVAAYGWSLSPWFDAHRPGLGWGEAVQMVPCCLPISGCPPWGPCHVCAAVCRVISAAVPLRSSKGPPAGRRDLGAGRGEVRIAAGMVPFQCR